jgi:hypothetical protein
LIEDIEKNRQDPQKFPLKKREEEKKVEVSLVDYLTLNIAILVPKFSLSLVNEYDNKILEI